MQGVQARLATETPTSGGFNFLFEGKACYSTALKELCRDLRISKSLAYIFQVCRL